MTFSARGGFLLLTLCSALIAAAQTYPDRPIRFVVPYAAGGSLDAFARILGQKLSASLKQPVLIDNRSGAGGNIGADFVAKSAPDGYTILMGAVATHAINPSLYRRIPYDAQKDFIAVTQLVSAPNVLILHPSIPANDVKGFIAYAKANPGKLNYGSGSTGSAGHLAGELFKTLTGTSFTHIPYKGAGPALQALLAGETQLMFDNLANAMPQIKAGTVRALAVTTAQRTPLAKDFPTLIEAGLSGFDISTWIGIFVPAKTPASIVKTLHTEFIAALHAPEVLERTRNLGSDNVGSTPEQFAAYIKSEAEKYAKVVKASGAVVD